ncbi:MAG: hypothetical protein CSA33_03520 [Desulfobulbus propionicus]|nr:MAG: hypothetical protein CSA33_03520 [Desulfobulbus propionicus]
MTLLFLFNCFPTPNVASAEDKEIRFASIPWTGVTIKTELAVLGYKASNKVQLAPYMTGAQYTLAVPTYVAQAGLKDC